MARRLLILVRTFLIPISVLACTHTAAAQATGKLAGTITDASTGEPLPGANVVIVGTQMGTAAGSEGDYFILGAPVGTYDVTASFVGFQPQTVEGVEINAGYTREINFALTPGAELEEIVVEYERPLIQKDAIGVPKVFTAEDLENLPVRGTASIVALQGGVASSEGSSDLYIRGGREEEVSFYVDGVKVIGLLGVPQQAVQEQEMLIGTVPARYGDAQSGVISITTKSGFGENFFGSAELITSQALDPYGYNLASLSLGGPLISDKLTFFLAAEGVTADDDDPFSRDVFTLSDEAYAEITQMPQAVRIVDDEGNEDFVRFPGDIAPGTTTEQIDAMMAERGLIPEGYHIAGHELHNATELLTADDFEREPAKHSPSRSISTQGKLHFQPVTNVSLIFGGGYNMDDDDVYQPLYQLYAADRHLVSDQRTWRTFGTWRHYLSGSTFYELSADYSKNNFWRYPNGFSRDVDDVLFYGDVDGVDADGNATIASEYNQTSRRYFQLSDDGTSYVRKYTDGSLPAELGVYGLFALPGAGGLEIMDYIKSENSQLRFSAHATTQIGVNQIEIGGEFERRTERYYRIFPAQLARYYADGSVEAGEEAAVTQYADLPLEVVRPLIGISGSGWYGYDYLGREKVDDQDLDAFDAGENLNVAPHEPIFFGGYIQDKIEYRDLVLNIGFRVDLFDANTQVLKDPFMTQPLIQARALDARPDVIGDDYVVYFSGAQATNEVVGFRDKDGNFYDANGEETTFQDLKTLGGPALDEAAPYSSIFEDYDPVTILQPRIGVSFPITNQALFFASYNVLSQRPTEWYYMPATAWNNISTGSPYPNSDLEPEVTKQYELGFRQRVGSSAAIQISGFYRTQKNKIGRRTLNAAAPVGGYYGHFNVDFTTTKGATLEFDLRRFRNVALRANYTLSFAQGTGSDALTAQTIAWRGTYFPDFIAPAAFDRRHMVNVWVDYRLGEGEGPSLGGARVLENFGVNLVAVIQSGNPYTQLETPVETPIFNQTNNFVIGGINEAVMPWTNRIDLRLDRRFQIGGGLSMTAFLWVRNLLDSDNVFGVYRGSGLPDSDGFLEGGEAERELLNSLSAESYIFHYQALTSDPLGPPTTLVGTGSFAGPRAFGLPRQTRLGVRLQF